MEVDDMIWFCGENRSLWMWLSYILYCIRHVLSHGLFRFSFFSNQTKFYLLNYLFFPGGKQVSLFLYSENGEKKEKGKRKKKERKKKNVFKPSS